MYNPDLLKPNTIDMLRDDFLNNIQQQICTGTITTKNYNYKQAHAEFKDLFHNYVENNGRFSLINLNRFSNREIIVGCHHYLDGLLIKYGNKLQVLEHDYKYYSRLDPDRIWSNPGELLPDQPLVIATPFPGYLGLHPDFSDILAEAKEKRIDVHLDGAWLSCSTGISVDVGADCIASIGISLSKGYAASWNRIGLRYTRTIDPHDPITIYDSSTMCPKPVVVAGIQLLKNVPVNYMWDTYGDSYNNIVKYFDLTPGNILFAAYDKNNVINSITDLLLGDKK